MYLLSMGQSLYIIWRCLVRNYLDTTLNLFFISSKYSLNYMNPHIRYTIIFLVFSIVGWIYENKIIEKTAYDTLFHIDGLKLPLLTIYGIGGVLIVYLSNFVSKVDKPVKIIIGILIITTIINVLECIVGQLSYQYNKYHTWSYRTLTLPTCNDYVSLTTFVCWMAVISVIVTVTKI